MPLYSNVILSKKPSSSGTARASNDDAPRSVAKKPAQSSASMKFLQDHLLSKRRSKQQTTPPFLSAKANLSASKLTIQTTGSTDSVPTSLNSKKALENSLWESEDEYDPMVPNSYEILQTEHLKAEEARVAACRRKRLDNIPNLMDIIDQMDSFDEVDGTCNNLKMNAIAPPPSLTVGTSIPPPDSSPTPTTTQETTSSLPTLNTCIPPPPTTNEPLTGSKIALKTAGQDDATRVVLLQNMVGPGEVDNDLESETKEECEKYGDVVKCLIYEIPNKRVPDDEAVRIFVEFRHIESARNAVNDLNGRYFGGRVVKASFYSPERFCKYDLSCED